MRKKIALLAAFCMTLSVIFSGCSSSGATKEEDNGGTTEKADTQKTTESSEKELRFTFVCPIQGNVYWNTCVAGMEDAAKELGNISINVVGPTQVDTTQFVKDLDSTIASQVDGIMLMCYDENMIGTSIDNATKAGIPVVTVDTDGANTSRIAYYGTANYDAGVMAGEEMVRLTGGKAKIIIETADLVATNMKERIDGFLSVIEKHDDMVVLSTEVASDVLEGAEVAAQFLTAYPECDTIYCAEGQGAKGVAQTIQERGLVDDITLLTFDEDQELLEKIQDGTIKATVAQDPYTMGYKSVFALKSVNDGEEIVEKINNIPVVIISEDNVAEYLKKYDK